jgi:hypothetical protein
MFAFPLRKTSIENRRPARNRQLGFVTLEKRNLLTAIDPLPIPPEPTDPPVEPPSEIAPTGDVFDGGTIGDGGGDSGGGGGEAGGGDTGGGENSAPILFGFSYSENNGNYQFFGWVTDDVDPTGLTVYFDGLISGAYTEVQAGGYFSFEITLEDPCGQVSAIFADAEWLWSNQETVTI